VTGRQPDGAVPAAWLTSWVSDVSVILSGLEITQRRGTSRRVRHDSQPPVDLALLPQLSKHPPYRLHIRRVERLVSRFEVNPAPHPLDGSLPLARIPHDNLAAGGVVLVDTHRHDVGLAGDAEGFVNLMLHRQTVRVPPESALDVMSSRVRMTSDHVLFD
jgi:hypothetical protein